MPSFNRICALGPSPPFISSTWLPWIVLVPLTTIPWTLGNVSAGSVKVSALGGTLTTNLRVPGSFVAVASAERGLMVFPSWGFSGTFASTIRSSATRSTTCWQSPQCRTPRSCTFLASVRDIARDRAGSTPSSFSCGDVSVKRASQEGILVACADRPRPIALRKAVWSGMKGVGLGTGRMGIECCRFRVHDFDADTAEVARRRGRRRIMPAIAGRRISDELFRE